ncbi:jg24919, partial [Pararge aegeria aegeria]
MIIVISTERLPLLAAYVFSREFQTPRFWAACLSSALRDSFDFVCPPGWGSTNAALTG